MIMGNLKKIYTDLDSIEIFGAFCLIALFGWGIYQVILGLIGRFF